MNNGLASDSEAEGMMGSALADVEDFFGTPELEGALPGDTAQDIDDDVYEDYFPSAEGSASSTISFPKLVLVDGKMEVVEDCIAMYRHSSQGVHQRTSLKSSLSDPQLQRSLKLRLVSGCGRSKEVPEDFFTMPSLRLTAVEKGYSEPVRDRDKHWALDSQREILDATPRSQKMPDLRLGRYPPPPKDPPGLMWAPAMQSLVRRQRLLRTGWIVSDTHCIVEVYGVGVCGRVVASGQTKRALIIEALSRWNSERHTLVIKINQIKALFPGREELLKPGKKRELVKALLDLLYFEYRVTYPAMRIDGRPFHPPVQLLTHTERADLPVEYPSSVCDVIRAISDPKSWTPPELLDDQSAIPLLEQTLKISSTRRETGSTMRRRERIIQAKQELLDQEAERRAWTNTPVRLRGLKCMRCVRKSGRLFVLQAYVFPMAPDVASIRGHVVEEVGRLRMRVSLGVAGTLAGLSSDPHKWSSNTVKMVSQFCLRNLNIRGNFNEGYAYFDFFGRRGGGAVLQTLKPAFHRIDYYRRHNDALVLLNKENDAIVAGEPRSCWHPYCNLDLAGGLGAGSSRQKPSWRPQCRPRRDIGKGIRLACRARKFGASLGIYSVYLVSKMSRGPLPITEGTTGERKLLDSELAPQLTIRVEVYFPYGVACNDIGVSAVELPPFTSMSMVFHRPDICNLTRHLQQHHNIAFRATYLTFYSEATPEEVFSAERAWKLLGEAILSKGRWCYKYRLQNPPPTPVSPAAAEASTATATPEPKLDVEDEFEFDENMLEEALGSDIPFKKKSEETVASAEEPSQEDKLAWMGGCPIDELLTRYDIEDCSQDVFHLALKMHIALGRQGEVSIPLQYASEFESTLFVPETRSTFPRKPELVWRWSNVIYSNSIVFASEAEQRPRPVFKVFVWAAGRELGLVALDAERPGDAYFLRVPSYIADEMCVEIQGLNETELALSLLEMFKEIKYYENECTPAVEQRCRAGLHFVEASEGVEVEDAIVDNDDDMMLMVLAAEEASKRRAEASASIAAAKKEKEIREKERQEREKKLAASRRKAKRKTGLRGEDEDFESDIDETEEEGQAGLL